MSSIAFHSGNKTENTIYLAFGIVVSLAIIRYFSPQSFDNPEILLGMAIFWGPIIGSLLFFIRLDRAMTFGLKEMCKSKYGTDMEREILIFDIQINQWQFSMTSDWEDPSMKFQSSLTRLMNGTDVHEDIWALKGWFYFLISLPLMVYSFAVVQIEIIWTLVFIEGIVIVMAFINYRGFINRCALVALFRALSEDRSVMQTRVEGDSSAPKLITSEIQKSIFDELNTMIESKDWLGFKRRFGALLEEYCNSFESSPMWYLKNYVHTWAKCFSAHREEDRDVWLSRIKVFRCIVRYIQSNGLLESDPKVATLLEVNDTSLPEEGVFYSIIDKIGVDETIEEAVFYAFYRLTNQSKQVDDEGVVRIVLNWYQNGASRFEEQLLSTSEIVTEPLAEEIISILLSEFNNEQIWPKIGRKSIDILLSQNKQPERKAVALRHALRSGNQEIKSIILQKADVFNLDFLKEVLTYLNSQDVALVKEAQSFFSRNYKSPNSYDELIANLANDSEASVRRNTVKLIEFLYIQEVESYRVELALIKFLQDLDVNVRREVLRFLVEHSHKLPREERIYSVIRIIKDTDEDSNNRRLASILTERFKEE